jgi:hypothetical protein
MNQNPNTNKECEVCEDYGGNPPPHVCSTPSPKDWEARFDEEFEYADFPMNLAGQRSDVRIKEFIRQEKAKSEKVSDETKEFYYQNGWRAGQKELAKEIIELQEDQPGEYGHGYDYAFQQIQELLTSKHLLD